MPSLTAGLQGEGGREGGREGGWLPALGHGCGLEGSGSRVCFRAEKSQLKEPEQPASEPQRQVPARARGGRSIQAGYSP